VSPASRPFTGDNLERRKRSCAAHCHSSESVCLLLSASCLLPSAFCLLPPSSATRKAIGGRGEQTASFLVARRPASERVCVLCGGRGAGQLDKVKGRRLCNVVAANSELATRDSLWRRAQWAASELQVHCVSVHFSVETLQTARDAHNKMHSAECSLLNAVCVQWPADCCEWSAPLQRTQAQEGGFHCNLQAANLCNLSPLGLILLGRAQSAPPKGQ